MQFLASDLDGTLVKLNEKNELYIEQKDIEALKKLRENNNKFIVSTGRSYDATVELMKENNISYDYLVVCNGALVIDNCGNEIIKNNMDFNVVKEIIDVIYSYEDIRPFVNCGKDSFLLRGRTDKDKIPDWLSIVDKDELTKKDRGYLIIGMHSIDRSKERVEEIRKVINNKYGDYVEAVRNNCYLDIVAKGSSKGQALTKLINLLDEDLDKLYTIGDSYNDIPMFDITKNSYTFNNSEVEVKNKANNLVDHVYECINDILL